jgi:hypothetical protein
MHNTWCHTKFLWWLSRETIFYLPLYLS